MKKLLLAGTSAAAIAVASAAGAADLAPMYKGPVVAPPVAFSWTGCYAGAHVGWGWGHARMTDHTTSNVFTAAGVGGPTGGLIDASDLQRSAGVDQSGPVFGGQVGCDYQFGSSFVVGVSGSVAGTDISGSGANPFTTAGPGGLMTAKTDFLADFSGRIGATWGQSLFYVKGGVAWSHNRYSADCVCEFDGATTFTGSDTVTGGIVGGGIEWAFAQNWSAFVEYDHYFFPTQTVNFTAAGSFTGPLNGLVDVKQEIDVVKVGVNYRLHY
jgi:outer membrane immunogenic protein